MTSSAITRLRAIVREVWGLFVDDGSFAGAILVWALLMGLIMRRWPTLSQWAGLGLLAGFALILIESAFRTARRHWNR